MQVDYSNLDERINHSITTCWDLQAQCKIVKNQMRYAISEPSDSSISSLNNEELHLSSLIDQLQGDVNALYSIKRAIEEKIDTWEANIMYASSLSDSADVVIETLTNSLSQDIPVL